MLPYSARRRLPAGGNPDSAAVAGGHGVVHSLGEAAQVGVGPGREVGGAGGIRQRGGDRRHHQGVGHCGRRARDGAAGVGGRFGAAGGDIPRVTGSRRAPNRDHATQLMVARVARGRRALGPVVAGPEDREARPVRAAGRADALRGVGHLGPGAAVLVGDGDGLVGRLQEQQQDVVGRDSRRKRGGNRAGAGGHRAGRDVGGMAAETVM